MADELNRLTERQVPGLDMRLWATNASGSHPHVGDRRPGTRNKGVDRAARRPHRDAVGGAVGGDGSRLLFRQRIVANTITYWASNQGSSLQNDKQVLTPRLRSSPSRPASRVNLEVISWEHPQPDHHATPPATA